MGLPPKAIFALNSIKSILISKIDTNTPQSGESQNVIITVCKNYTTDSNGLNSGERRAKPVKSTVRMRHAKSGGAFQTMCRRKDWASPVF